MAIEQQPVAKALQLLFQVGYDEQTGEILTKRRTYSKLNLNATPETLFTFAQKIEALQTKSLMEVGVRDDSLLTQAI